MSNEYFLKNAKIVIFLVSLLFFLVLAEIIYLNFSKSMSEDMLSKKVFFVKLTGLPDLAFFSDIAHVRHRSLSDLYSIYSDDSSLREYSSATFSITHKEMN